MADLRVTDVELDATAARLREAASPISDPYCIDPSVTGSDAVAAALADADALLGRIIAALARVSDSAAADAQTIGTALTDADARLAARG